MNDRVLAEEDHLARCRRDQVSDHLRVQSVLLCRCSDDSLRPSVGADADRAGLEQRGLEVVDQIVGILDTDAEADEVFGQVARLADCRIDRGVTVR